MAARIGPRRLVAFALDWCLIGAWGGALFLLTRLFPGAVPAPSGPWAGQLTGLLTMTLPVVLYFALTESSPWQASLGKRALGLRVSAAAGGRLSLGRSLARSSVKFAPWEFGHMLAQQAVFSAESGLPAWTVVPAVIAFVGPVVWLAELFRTGRTPYDRISESTVFVRRRRRP